MPSLPRSAIPEAAVAVEVLSHGGFPQLSCVCGGAEAIATVGRGAGVRLR